MCYLGQEQKGRVRIEIGSRPTEKAVKGHSIRKVANHCCISSPEEFRPVILLWTEFLTVRLSAPSMSVAPVSDRGENESPCGGPC